MCLKIIICELRRCAHSHIILCFNGKRVSRYTRNLTCSNSIFTFAHFETFHSNYITRTYIRIRVYLNSAVLLWSVYRAAPRKLRYARSEYARTVRYHRKARHIILYTYCVVIIFVSRSDRIIFSRNFNERPRNNRLCSAALLCAVLKKKKCYPFVPLYYTVHTWLREIFVSHELDNLDNLASFAAAVKYSETCVHVIIT